MEKVGILVVSYGSREAAIVDALIRSVNYNVELYVADRQLNPFNKKRSFKHVVIPDLNINDICKFADTNKDEIDFVLVGPEKPIIAGLRDLIEQKTQIPVLCPKQKYAIEASKIEQRLLFKEIAPLANPRFQIFNPKDYKNNEDVRRDVYLWLDQLADKAVIKPDKPTAGKGVGVWGDHFVTREQLFEHFMSNFQYGSVLIEEKIDGEESSFQVFSDGEHIVPLPSVRDYKRAFDKDKGPNTGGMGSYKDVNDYLPFLTSKDRDDELSLANTIFQKWKEKIGDNTALRGVPLYLAFMHSKSGIKILENNSRPGDPEIINILPLLKDDFVDVCYRMLNRTLSNIRLEKDASVLTYKVPPNYGGYMTVFPHLVNSTAVDTPVDLSKVNSFVNKFSDKLRVYPGSMEIRESGIFALSSRAVAILGVSDSIEEAREISLEGASAISGGALWNRTDIASKQHILSSIRKMELLRSNK
jgi:phosphoribosylamine--glycine ligase